MSALRRWPAAVAGAVLAAAFILICDLLAIELSAALSFQAAAERMRVRFSTPLYNARPGDCAPDATSADDIDSVMLRGLWREGDTVTVATHLARSPGAPDTFTIERTAALRRVWVESKDRHGNRSCPSNVLDLWPASFAPEPAPAGSEPTVQIFDVAGRRINPPLPPGIYFRRVHGSRVMRIVVIR